MKFIFIIFVSLISLTSFSSALPDLPKHYPLTRVKLADIGNGNEVDLKVSLILPSDHKLNKGAPSDIEIYELSDKKWKKTKSINLNNFFLVGNTLTISEKINLENPEAPIAIDSTVYHCDYKNTHCVIESFQGIARRKKGAKSKVISAKFVGSNP